MPDVRTFRADTLHEALDRVRAELGADAVILATRSVPVRRLTPWGKREEVEITAGVGISTRAAAARSVSAGAIGGQIAAAYGLNAAERRAAAIVRELQRRGTNAAWTEPAAALRSPAASPPAAAPVTGPVVTARIAEEATTALMRRLDALEAQIRSVASPIASPAMTGPVMTGPAVSLPVPKTAADPHRFRERLCRAEVAADLVEQLLAGSEVASLADPSAARKCLLDRVAAAIPCSGPLQPPRGGRTVLALVGPTGVGKTTTLAKLAANYHARDGLRTGLITVDTYRVAAVDQLRTYARIIGLPMEVVTTAAEMTAALVQLGRCEVVLIDTAGRSPRDAEQIQELTTLLAAAKPDAVHLVLSLTSGPAAIRRAAARFSAAGPTAVVATKLDEAEGAGPLLTLCQQTGLPLAHVTTGQDVPDDIEPARADRLARRIVNGPPAGHHSETIDIPLAEVSS